MKATEGEDNLKTDPSTYLPTRFFGRLGTLRLTTICVTHQRTFDPWGLLFGREHTTIMLSDILVVTGSKHGLNNNVLQINTASSVHRFIVPDGPTWLRAIEEQMAILARAALDSQDPTLCDAAASAPRAAGPIVSGPSRSRRSKSPTPTPADLEPISTYDDWSWHAEAASRAGAPPEAAATQIGMFLAWAIVNQLGSALHASSTQLHQRTTTPGRYLLDRCDGKLLDEDLNDEGNEFARAYYLAEEDGYEEDHLFAFANYQSQFDVPDTWKTYDALSTQISRSYEQWRADRGSSAARS